MGRIDSKVCIVTGAASGIGEASAHLLAAEGGKVVCTDVQTELGNELADSLRNSGHDALFVEHDVREEAAWESVVEAALKAYGSLDVLVNNAGIGATHIVTDVSLEEWRRVLSVNLDGVFLGMKHSIRAMKDGGAIVNISSIDGIMGAPLRAAYCASKGGVSLLTKAVAIECAQLGRPVRVNSVHPGPIATNIFAAAAEYSQIEVLDTIGGLDAAIRYYTDATPMARFGESEEVAKAVLFLASDESSYMTGSEVRVDGGWTAGKTMPLVQGEGGEAGVAAGRGADGVLRGMVTALHAQLGHMKHVDAEGEALLVSLLDDILEALDSADERDVPSSGGSGLGDRARAAVERFETSHPDLTQVLIRIADALGRAAA